NRLRRLLKGTDFWDEDTSSMTSDLEMFSMAQSDVWDDSLASDLSTATQGVYEGSRWDSTSGLTPPPSRPQLNTTDSPIGMVPTFGGNLFPFSLPLSLASVLQQLTEETPRTTADSAHLTDNARYILPRRGANLLDITNYEYYQPFSNSGRTSRSFPENKKMSRIIEDEESEEDLEPIDEIKNIINIELCK
ncbi:Protein of unknown function, partial [Gryllus bimaculatus]